jgi:hypothetical protein
MPDEPIEQQPAARQMCMVCGSYVAKTFIDINKQRVHLCQPDAYTILRMVALQETEAMLRTLTFVKEQIYGKVVEE